MYWMLSQGKRAFKAVRDLIPPEKLSSCSASKCPGTARALRFAVSGRSFPEFADEA